MECNVKGKRSDTDQFATCSVDPEGSRRQVIFPLSGKTPLWKRVFPFLTGGGILVYLFSHIDIQQCFAALGRADISAYAPWLVVFAMVSFLMDAHNLREMLRHFQYPISFGKALNIRGITYLLMTIDYSLSLGALVYYLKRDLSIPVMRSTSLMLFFNAVTHFALVIMTIVGLLILMPSSRLLQYFLIFCICFSMFNVVIVALLKKLPERGFMQKIKNLHIIKTFHEASWASFWVLVFWRALYYSLFIIFFYVAFRSFHMEIPIITLLAYIPIILLVISLPIAPCGFGSTQAAMIYLFKGYGTSENIMALGLTYTTSIIVFRSLIGLFFANHMGCVDAKK
jgi:uncharacterized membrane protein YbhN (UPF0104 family)